MITQHGAISNWQRTSHKVHQGHNGQQRLSELGVGRSAVCFSLGAWLFLEARRQSAVATVGSNGHFAHLSGTIGAAKSDDYEDCDGRIPPRSGSLQPGSRRPAPARAPSHSAAGRRRLHFYRHRRFDSESRAHLSPGAALRRARPDPDDSSSLPRLEVVLCFSGRLRGGGGNGAGGSRAT